VSFSGTGIDNKLSDTNNGANMSKFKKGDKVRCVRASGWHGLTVGKVYEVARDATDNGVCLVLDDDGKSRTPVSNRFELVKPTGSYTVHYDGYQVGDPHLTINDATNWIQDNGVGGLVYTILETIARRKFEVVEKVQRELKAI
jgi:hypothetical protein